MTERIKYLGGLPKFVHIERPIKKYGLQTQLQTRKGLHVSDDFTVRILEEAGDTGEVRNFAIETIVTGGGVDTQIKVNRPKTHRDFDPASLCATLVWLIERQPEGKPGLLTTDEQKINILYVTAAMLST